MVSCTRKQTWTYLTQWPWAVAVITLPWWKHWQRGADASRYLLLHCASRTWDYATSNTRHMARQCAWSHKHFGSSLGFSPATDYLQERRRGCVCTQLCEQPCTASVGLEEGTHAWSDGLRHWACGKTVCIKLPSFSAHRHMLFLAPTASLFDFLSNIVVTAKIYLECLYLL